MYKALKVDDKTWIEGYVWRGSNYACIIPHNLGIDADPNTNKIDATAYQVIKETICHITGVMAFWKDQNGAHLNNIWEHDLLEVEYDGMKVIGEVKLIKGTYVVFNNSLPGGYVSFASIGCKEHNVIDARIVGNAFDKLVGVKNSLSKESNSKQALWTECPFYQKRESNYDVLSGHSDYQEYCTKHYDKKIIPSVHCTLCKQKENT